MGGIKRGRDLDDDPRRQLEVEPAPAPDQRLEVGALDVIHRDE